MILIHDGQVTEAFADHEVESISGTGVGFGAQGVLGHDLGDGDAVGLDSLSDNAEGKVLCGKDTCNTIIIVGDKDAVFTLGGHKLGSFCDGGVRLDLESLAGSKGKDRTRGCLSSLAGAGRVGSLLVQVGFDLATDGLGA